MQCMRTWLHFFRKISKITKNHVLYIILILSLNIILILSPPLILGQKLSKSNKKMQPKNRKCNQNEAETTKSCTFVYKKCNQHICKQKKCNQKMQLDNKFLTGH